jgi:hypothetical protein
MSKNFALVKRPASGDIELWIPTTLDVVGKNEEYLEDTIAESPELLRMENRSTGIHGPYKVFRQLEFTTPQDRGIRPDIVFLAASGHIIVVEVKLYSNPELRDRRVVAQIVDYVASLTALSPDEIGQLFGAIDGSQRAWTDRVKGLFPDEHDPEELANVILSRVQTGQINMFVACDKAPAGLQEMLRGISSQSALHDFSLDLVEIEPHVRKGDGDIFFVPRTRLTTEVVGRTVVTVTYEQGNAKPSVKVETNTVDEMEQNLKQAQQSGGSPRKKWTREMYDAELVQLESAVRANRIRDLITLAEGHPDLFFYPKLGTGQTGSLSFYDEEEYRITSIYLSGRCDTSRPNPKTLSASEVQKLLTRYAKQLSWGTTFKGEEMWGDPPLSVPLEKLSEDSFNALKQFMLEFATLRSAKAAKQLP